MQDSTCILSFIHATHKKQPREDLALAGLLCLGLYVSVNLDYKVVREAPE